MRHKYGYKKFGSSSSQRISLLRNMATSLLKHERIDTTLAKAKELRCIVDRLITLGKRGDLHAKRQASSFLYDDEATAKVFADLAKRFKNRHGGYTRILKRGTRLGDKAEVATIELVDYAFVSKIEKDMLKQEKKTKKEEAKKD